MTESSATDRDPWRARLSEFLDGDLSTAERAEAEAHLARCADCTRLLGELRALVRAARALPAPVPEHDLWPGLAARLATRTSGPRSLPRWLVFAAGVLLTTALFLVRERSRTAPFEVAQQSGESYLLLLHGAEGLDAGLDAAEHAAVVERYGRWARALGERCLGGEELEEHGLELRPASGEVAASPLAAGDRVGGYFLLQTRDGEEARALAETCPHLEQGGWIELRRIQTTPPAESQR